LYVANVAENCAGWRFPILCSNIILSLLFKTFLKNNNYVVYDHSLVKNKATFSAFTKCIRKHQFLSVIIDECINTRTANS